MISVEQIKMLEERVHHVVQRMSALRRENQTLHEQLGEATARVAALEGQIAHIADSHAAIEAGILSALQHLDTLEDEAVEIGDAVLVDAAEAADTVDLDEAAAADPELADDSDDDESPVGLTADAVDAAADDLGTAAHEASDTTETLDDQFNGQNTPPAVPTPELDIF